MFDLWDSNYYYVNSSVTGYIAQFTAVACIGNSKILFSFLVFSSSQDLRYTLGPGWQIQSK